MARHSDVRVVLERSTRSGRVYVDGRELQGVRAVTVNHRYDAPPTVQFEILVATAAVEYVDRLDEHQEVSSDAAS